MKKLQLKKDLITRLSRNNQKRLLGGMADNNVDFTEACPETMDCPTPPQKDTVLSRATCGCKTLNGCL